MSQVNKGIVIYQIEKNGCLNGVYTNEIEEGKIYNEIARKTKNNSMLEGEYNCFYFEEDNKENNAVLEIKKDKVNVYDVSWVINKTPIFKGKGYIMNNNQFVVRYESNKI